MLFNSIDFAIFLPIVFLLYWAFNKTLSIQNCLLLIASYFFYACWDWRFLGLILFSTTVDNFIGLKIHQGKTLLSKRVWTSMLTTFGLVLFAWIFFRSPNLAAAFGFIENMFRPSLFSLPETRPWILVLLVAVFLVIEWVGKENEYAIQRTGFHWHKPLRWSFYPMIAWSGG